MESQQANIFIQQYKIQIIFIISIIIMKVNKYQQNQQCFENEFDIPNQYQQIQLKVQIKKKINDVIPANELRTARRPEHMSPRTFYLDRPLYLLPQVLNATCQELITEVQTTQTKTKIKNPANLSLQQYFNQKNFRQTYNKLQTYRNYNKSYTGKLKGIDSLIDYNWKFFKQLQIQRKHYYQYKKDMIDSDFECGNICRAYHNIDEIQQKQYYLLIENDLNTYGYNNWFFFRVKNKQIGKRRFIIANFIKKTKFYQQGMLVSIFSMKKHQYRNVKWFKGGNNINFQTINILRYNHEGQYYNSLYFQYDFQYENDDVYFAMNQPYSYSRLIKFIRNTSQCIQGLQIQVKNICYSISNNIIPSIRYYKQQNRTNNVILILARQHPCQTVGSFVTEGLMRLFKNYSILRDQLCEKFEFIVIPMVNPDGVIHGMSRTNMSGLDLNRQWGQNGLKQLTPETIKIKQYIINLQKTKQIRYMIDFHGHGKKLNTFLFCCKDQHKQNYRELSLCLSKLQERFNIFNCTYGINKDKENTIRSQLNNIETSLYGWKRDNQIIHFNQIDYDMIAKRLLEAIFLIQCNQQVTQKYFGFTKDIIMLNFQALIQKIIKIQQSNLQNDQMLSDSDPQGDILDLKDLLGKCENKLLKKRIQQCLNYNKKLQKGRNTKKSFVQVSKKQRIFLSLKKEMSNKILNPIPKVADHEKNIRKSVISDYNREDNQRIFNNSKMIVRRQIMNHQKKSQQAQDIIESYTNNTNIRYRHNPKLKTQVLSQKCNRLKTIVYKKVNEKNQRTTKMKINRERFVVKYTEPGEDSSANHSQRKAIKNFQELSNTILEARYERLLNTFNEATPFLKIKKAQKQTSQHHKQIRNIIISQQKESLLRKYTQDNNTQQQSPTKRTQESRLSTYLQKNTRRGTSLKRIIKNYHYPIF